MTSKRDLKKRVRERQARTGERYTTALGHVRRKRTGGAIPVVEMVDLGEEARRLGLKGRILMTPDLDRACGVAALEKLRDALHATQEDPATRRFRAVLLAGERRVPEAPSANELWIEGRRFMARARAGVGGVSEGGSMIALPVAASGGIETVIAILWAMTLPGLPLPPEGAQAGAPWDRDPMIIVTTPGGIQRVFQFSISGGEER